MGQKRGREEGPKKSGRNGVQLPSEREGDWSMKIGEGMGQKRGRRGIGTGS